MGESSQTRSLGMEAEWWGSRSYCTRHPLQDITNKDSTGLAWILMGPGSLAGALSIQARGGAKHVVRRKDTFSSDEEGILCRPIITKYNVIWLFSKFIILQLFANVLIIEAFLQA